MFQDSTGHGTSVAGIVAAKDNGEGITGINENVDIYSAKVLDESNRGLVSNVVKAIYWAIDKKVNIINMSFATSTDSPLLKKAVQDAYNSGILVIAGVGNAGGEVQYPAAYDEVIGVGATNTQSEITDESSKGSAVELVAPGEKILSTGEFYGVTVASGTSMAAPHVTGAAALIWQQDLSKSNEFVRSLLSATANKYGDRNSYGNGLLDVKHALENYKKFEKTYMETQGAPVVIENESEILQFEGVEYVDGVWKQEQHEKFVEETYVGSTPSRKARLKLGAVLQDKYFPAKMGWSDETGKLSYTYCRALHALDANYVVAYAYLYNVARAFRIKAKSSDTVSTSTFKDSQIPTNDADNTYNIKLCENIRDNVLKKIIINWITYVSGHSKTNGHVADVFTGMLMHLATDMYAHRCVYKNENGYWIFLRHGNNGSIKLYNNIIKTINEDPTYILKYNRRIDAKSGADTIDNLKRCDSATKVAKKVLSNLNPNSSSYKNVDSDFLLGTGVDGFGMDGQGGFKLDRLKDFAAKSNITNKSVLNSYSFDRCSYVDGSFYR